MAEPLKNVLVRCQGMTLSEAEAEIADAKKEIMEIIEEGGNPMDYCEERWGLEPDYLDDLLF